MWPTYWWMGPGTHRSQEKPLSLVGFIKFEQPVEHLALILIETVGFWLFSGLAYFPSSVSASVVSDLMKLNWLHLILWAQEKSQNACSPLSPFWNIQNKCAVSWFGSGAGEFLKGKTQRTFLSLISEEHPFCSLIKEGRVKPRGWCHWNGTNLVWLQPGKKKS